MTKKFVLALPLLLTLVTSQVQAAVSLDRTRVIYPGGSTSISLTIRNNSKDLPYLAQAWMEDINGKKINSPFTMLPPVQRVEPDTDSLIKVQALPALSLLPQDKESLFYLNVREIPPRSDTPNALQLALQTRIKFFYRPTSLLIEPGSNKSRWQENVTLQHVGGKYKLNNPTPYYVSIVSAASDLAKGGNAENFEPVMIAPNSSAVLNIGVDKLGKQPTFTYIDDYGGRNPLSYQCSSGICRLQSVKNNR